MATVAPRPQALNNSSNQQAERNKMFTLPTSKKSTNHVTEGANACANCKHCKLITPRDWQWDLVVHPGIMRTEPLDPHEGTAFVCRRNDERPMPLLCREQRDTFGGCGPEGLAFEAKPDAKAVRYVRR